MSIVVRSTIKPYFASISIERFIIMGGFIWNIDFFTLVKCS